MSLTTIIVTKETRDALKRMGLKGETYDEIVSKLIKQRKGDLPLDLTSRSKSK